MALKQPFAVKQVITNTELELKADSGEAFMVWDIFTYDPVSSYVTVKIEKTTVGYFRLKGVLGGHQVALRGRKTHSHHIYTAADTPGAPFGQIFPIRGAQDLVSKKGLVTSGDNLDDDVHVKDAVRFNWPIRNETLLGWLRQKGLWTGFPVAEGETFRLEGAKNPNGRQVITYGIYEPGDISPEMENGSKSMEYLFINYANCGGSISSSGDHLFSTSANPAEFPDFPFGKVCPAKHEIDILGILGSPFAPKENDGTHYSYTRFLKLLKGREILFDEDRNGIIFEVRSLDLGNRIDEFADGISLIGNKSEYDDNDPLMFDPPLTFIPGDELNMYVTLVSEGDGQDIDIYEHEIALIEKVRRLA